MGLKPLLYVGGVAIVAVAAGSYWMSGRTTTGTTAMVAPYAAPPGVTFQGPRYADGKGMTVYTSDKDEAGKSNCAADCAKTWHPVVALANAEASGSWSLVVRADGGKQWAFHGKPIYTFDKDANIGDIKGNGAENGTWHAVPIDLADGLTTPVGVAVEEVAAADGRALVDDRGLTVYAFDGAAKADKEAVGSDWLPLTSAEIANPVGDFTIISRADGRDQWAYKGRPLYTYARDITPGDAKGIGVDPRWQVALVARYFMPPNLVVRSNPGMDTILATTQGTAVYMHDGYRYQVGTHYTRGAARGIPAVGRSIGLKGCDDKCLKVWNPVVASADAQPSGHWTILTRDNGAKQWAYEGYALYTYTGDKKAGDMVGNDTYDYEISQRADKVADASLPISLVWHVVFP